MAADRPRPAQPERQLSRARSFLLVPALALGVASAAVLLAPGRAHAAECTQVVPPPAEMERMRGEFLKLINGERKRKGLSQLGTDGKLEAAALDYACLLATTDHFDHTGPDGSHPGDRIRKAGYKWCTYAENLALGQRNVAEAFDGWMHSEGHYKNMVLDAVDEIGFAMVQEDRGGGADAKPKSGIADILKRYGKVTVNKGPKADGSPVPGRRYWVLELGRKC